jgi:hypothetical protein
MILEEWRAEKLQVRYRRLGDIWVIREGRLLVARVYDPDAEEKAREMCESHNQRVAAARKAEERAERLRDLGPASRILAEALERLDG